MLKLVIFNWIAPFLPSCLIAALFFGGFAYLRGDDVWTGLWIGFLVPFGVVASMVAGIGLLMILTKSK